MKLRIIIQSNDIGHAVHAQGSVHQTHRSFDVDAPEVVEFLSQKETYIYRNVVGVEIVETGLAALARGGE